MKHLLGFVMFCWMFTVAASAQQWTGSTDETGSITRLGKVGIGLDPADVMSKLDIIGPLIVRREGVVPKGIIAHAAERLRLVGTDADYIISLQDGTGRVQHYWNATTGVDARYQVSGERAGRILFNPAGSPIFAIDHAPEGVAGDTIAWNPKFAVHGNGDLIGARWLSVNSGAVPTVPLDVQGSGKLTGHLQVKNGLFVEGGLSRAYNTEAALQVSGGTADYMMAVQDGSGRVLQYWNANPGAPATYQVANEAAGRILFSPQAGTSLFDIAFAPPGTPDQAISWQSRLRIDQNGNVGIGTTNPQSKLAVDGTIRATEVIVTANVDVPDYVFDDDYDLPTLEQVQAHIDAHGHLLDIPSAAEVEAGGIVMGELQMALLKKIEELTLYILEQSKHIAEQAKRIAALEAASSVTGE